MKYILASFLSLVSVTSFSQTSSEILKKQIAAFNNHDTEALTKNISEDFIWFSVMDDSLIVESNGIEEFSTGMKNYFTHFENVQSVILEPIVHGNFVSFKETVSWTKNGKTKSQSSLGTYKIVNGKISRAWYFIE